MHCSIWGDMHGYWNVGELHSKTGVRGNADLVLTDWAGRLSARASA